MIEFLDGQPKGLCQIAEHECDIWIEGKNESGPYAYMGLQFFEFDVSLHLEVVRLSATTLKDLIADWAVVKEYLKGRGVKNVIATNWDDASGTWTRFIGYFDFSEPRRCLVSQLNLGG